MEPFLPTVVISTLISTVAGAFLNAWLESRKTKKLTRFEALSAAVNLEGYAIACAGKISDHYLALSSDGHAGKFMATLPEIPELPVVAGFLNPKKAKVAERLMTLPQEVQQAEQFVAFIWEINDIYGVRKEATSQTAKTGMCALELATDIRNKFHLPKRHLIFGEFDIYRTLSGCISDKGGNV